MYILERDVEDPLDCSTSLSNRKERNPVVKFLLTVLTHAIQKLALAVLRALPPEYRPIDTYTSLWQPAPFHQCANPGCAGLQLHFDGQYWVCPGCYAKYWFIPVQRNTEPMRIGDLARSHHASVVKREQFSDGEQTRHLPSIPPARKAL